MYSLKVERPNQPMSFKDIMNEQALGVDIWPNNQEETSQPTESTQENTQDSKKDVPEQTGNVNQLDEDYILALQLQEELDMQEQYEEEVHRFPNEKVSVGKQKNKPTQIPVQSSASLLDYCVKGDEFEDYDDYEDYDDEEEGYGDEEDPKKRYEGGMIKNIQGGLPKRDTFISKHDLVLDSIKKAEEIDNLWDGNSLGDMKGTRISGKIYNNLKSFNQKGQGRRTHKLSRDEYMQTQEQVIDQRTRLFLFKMTNNILKQINGCISTGKEASVFHAEATDEETFKFSTNPKEQRQRENTPYFEEMAVKIFKTSLNEFKNRAIYMEGDHRFAKSNKHNPRKMIKVWAEKEMRNLKRVAKVESINAPKPVLLREHILLMEFIGEKGKHAPQLKEVTFKSNKGLLRAYNQVVNMMRDLFQQCNLVHSDLSEFNLLYFKKKVYMIDFAAAVETETPNSLEFLRNDCANVTKFFEKKGLKVMSERDLFTFVTDPSVQNVEEYIREACEKEPNLSHEQQVDENVFKKSYIPVNISQIKDPFVESSVGENKFLQEQLKEDN